jgi:hypothetical protein
MTLVAASFLSVSSRVVLALAGAAFLWFFLLPAVPVLYSRYRAWLLRKAAGG